LTAIDLDEDNIDESSPDRPTTDKTANSDIGHGGWTVLRGPLTDERIADATEEIAREYGLSVNRRGAAGLQLTGPDGLVAAVRWRLLPLAAPDTLSHHRPEVAQVEVLVEPVNPTAAIRKLVRVLRQRGLAFTNAELGGIVESMPLLRYYSDPAPVFDRWALIFRDHYVENSVGFLLAMQRVGIPAQWIYVLDKGDRTRNRERVHATFLEQGYHSDLLDNAAINDPVSHLAELRRVRADMDQFIARAHAANRRILLVDDGGLLAMGYGAAGAPMPFGAPLSCGGLARVWPAISPTLATI